MNYIVKEETPAPEEYCELRRVCGLSQKTLEAAKLGLPKSLFAVTIRLNGELVGMGRAIGDLGCFVQIVDIAVRPDQQGKKLGNIVMDKIMEFVKRDVPECCFVNLFADVSFLYQKYGFVDSVKSQGMYLDWKKLSGP